MLGKTLKEYLEGINSINSLVLVDEKEQVIYDSKLKDNYYSDSDISNLDNIVLESKVNKEIIERPLPFEDMPTSTAYQIKADYVVKIKVVS